jgi:hypothetical protein
MNLVEYNRRFKNAACPTCGAWRGDPCRTPKKARVTRPHRERVKLVKATEVVERSLGSVKGTAT